MAQLSFTNAQCNHGTGIPYGDVCVPGKRITEMLLRLHYWAVLILCLISTAFCSYEVWPDPVDDGRENFPKPTSWEDKNYGQWCRNRTIGRHVQCQMGSSFHMYVCCGEDGTECCFRLQPIVIAYGGGLGSIFVVSLIFGLLLKFNIICPISNQRDEIEYQDVPKHTT
ncbi:hypothetical protein Tcan_17160 [Toxocara canis]|uniref:Uncharacterized protein n=1 Tax=Toxocara canis TaxID=6265 RepID=A0A0B2VYB7_TOXCA|nr:hypothetical protein Tcan_17160 [Toxocara canis]